MSRTGLVTDEWYESPPVDLGERVIVFTGRTPWMRHMLDTGPLGEHARWIHRLINRYEKEPWWRLWGMPPRYFDIRDYEPPGPPTLLEQLGGYLVTAVAVWRALRG